MEILLTQTSSTSETDRNDGDCCTFKPRHRRNGHYRRFKVSGHIGHQPAHRQSTCRHRVRRYVPSALDPARKFDFWQGHIWCDRKPSRRQLAHFRKLQSGTHCKKVSWNTFCSSATASRPCIHQKCCFILRFSSRTGFARLFGHTAPELLQFSLSRMGINPR